MLLNTENSWKVFLCDGPLSSVCSVFLLVAFTYNNNNHHHIQPMLSSGLIFKPTTAIRQSSPSTCIISIISDPPLLSIIPSWPCPFVHYPQLTLPFVHRLKLTLPFCPSSPVDAALLSIIPSWLCPFVHYPHLSSPFCCPYPPFNHFSITPRLCLSSPVDSTHHLLLVLPTFQSFSNSASMALSPTLGISLLHPLPQLIIVVSQFIFCHVRATAHGSGKQLVLTLFIVQHVLTGVKFLQNKDHTEQIYQSIRQIVCYLSGTLGAYSFEEQLTLVIFILQHVFTVRGLSSIQSICCRKHQTSSWSSW